MNAPQANPYVTNPYVAPVPEAAAHAPGVPGLPLASRLEQALYTPNQVALATFLGSPFGGAVIMAINEHRVGKTASAVKTLLAGLVGTAVLFAVASVIPDSV